MKIISPFGPKIGKIKLPKKIIRIINQEVDRIINNEILSNKLNYSKKLVGQVKQEFQLTKNFINKNLTKVIEKEVKLFIKKTLKKTVKKIKIKNLWIVRQFENEYNPVHYHEGHLSAVGYLKIPKNLNQSKKKFKTNGTIDFINGSKNFLSDSIYNHTPKVGDMIFFPNYLMHTAYPFHVKGERRSFSLNIELDQSIANVFHD
ncbi:MAG: putative 2OG-Fe(II) oxygenase [Pelagibacteraceae bacterium]